MIILKVASSEILLRLTILVISKEILLTITVVHSEILLTIMVASRSH
jgi:hypothetical protein